MAWYQHRNKEHLVRNFRATVENAKAQDGPRVQAAEQSTGQGQGASMAKQRISYVPFERMDTAMQEEMRRCEREGTPRPESSVT